jgi:hypothetical protein
MSPHTTFVQASVFRQELISSVALLTEKRHSGQGWHHHHASPGSGARVSTTTMTPNIPAKFQKYRILHCCKSSLISQSIAYYTVANSYGFHKFKILHCCKSSLIPQKYRILHCCKSSWIPQV